MESLEETLNNRFCRDFEDFEKQPLPVAKPVPEKNGPLFKDKDGEQPKTGTMDRRTPNADDFERVTLRQSLKGRTSTLGNAVYHMRPRELLRTLHQKTHFKACQTIQVTKDTAPLASNSLHIAMDELQAQFRDIGHNLDALGPEGLDPHQLNNLRYAKIRAALNRTAVGFQHGMPGLVGGT